MLIKVINAYDAWAEKSMHGKTYEDIIRITSLVLRYKLNKFN